MQQTVTPAPGAANYVDSFLPERGGYPRYPGEVSFFSVASIRAILWRQRLIIIGIVGIALVLGLVITLLMTPIYTASTTVQVSTDRGQIVEGSDLVDPYIATNEVARYLTTMAGVISSRKTALRVVDALNLQDNEVLLGGMIEEGPEPGVSAEVWNETRRMVAAGILRGNVDVLVPADSRIVEIAYSSESPALAANIANSYTQNFLEANVDLAVEANSYARTYLEGQIAELRISLQEAEVLANNYARNNRIIGQSLTNGGSGDGEGSAAAPSITATNLANINQTYADARARRIVAEQRWRAVASIPAAQLTEVQDNNTVLSLRTREAEVRSALSDLRERYREDYPQIRELAAQLESIEGQLSAAGNEIKAGIQSEFQIASRQEVAIAGELERVSNQTLDEQDLRVQYNLLDRNVQAYREQLAALLQRYNQIASATNLRSNNVTILDNATVPSSQTSPNMLKNLLVALILGLGLASALVILREALDDRLRSIEDVEQKLSIPALGQTPNIPGDVGDQIADSFSPISEAYSSIRASLDFALPGNERQVIQFTSSQASEGKTTSCIALARKYAAVGRKVLIVDMDLRRPSVAKSLGCSASSDGGVVDVLYGRLPIDRALVTGIEENLDVLPVGKIPPNPIEILSSGLIAEFLEKCRSRYDIILVDSSPVMGIADAPLLSRFVDGVVFVVEANGAHSGQAKTALQRLRETGANIIGAIVTKYRALEAGQSYNYQYQYYTYSDEG